MYSDWLDALVSMGFLQRDGLMEGASYSNTPTTAMFLDRSKSTYMGGIPGDGEQQALQVLGRPRGRIADGKTTKQSKHGNMHFFEELYKNPEWLHEFMDAMSDFQAGNFMALVNAFDFSKYKTIADLGGADGFLCCMIALQHPRVTCPPTTFLQ